MNCPVCNHPLKQLTVSNVQLDACDGGCGGIWFDRFELTKFDEPHDQAGLQLLDLKRDPKISVDYQKRINCPKCNDSILMRHFFSVKRQVEVDDCPSCAGTWLDAGELRTIRSEYATEAERRQAAEVCFAEMFNEQVAELQNMSESEKVNFRRIVNVFRFICPSYYIPGKQPWGAF
jgi:Zn-finger nucleic acid-binding protein